MHSKTLTGITSNSYLSGVDLPFYINDIFFASSPISLCTTLSFLNNLIGTSISSGNISNYKLYVRLTDTLTTPLNLISDFTVDLNSSNIIDSSLVVSLNNIFKNISNDFLSYNTTEIEKNNLYKSYKIIFRIFDASSEATHLLNKYNLLTNDIEQTVNICFDTSESGPYEVGFKVFDVLDKVNFTPTEIISEFNKNNLMVGGESFRCFYPKNKLFAPIVIVVHGVTHEQEDYDAYMQRFASFGFFCISININLQNGKHIKNKSTGSQLDFTLQASANFPWASAYLIKLIDHFKRNITKIAGGFFSNKIDFSKINFMGHSRGGSIIHVAKKLLDVKNSQYSTIQNTTIDSSDIKSLIKIAAADAGTVASNGVMVRDVDFTRVNFVQENDIHYFSNYINIPTLCVRTQNEGDITLGTNLHDIKSGITYSTNRVLTEKIIITNQHLGHSELRDAYGDPEPIYATYQTQANYNPIVYGRNETYLNYNSTDIDLTLFTSEFILFLAVHNYNSTKLKKLRFSKNNIKNKKINTEKYPNYYLTYLGIDDIKYILDSYDGITMSYAGSNGLTFSSIGYTYDYGYDADFYREFTNVNFNPGLTFMAALKENKITGVGANHFLNPGRLVRFNINDTFNGIMNCLHKSLFLPIQSNFYMGYTLGSSINLNENEYICLTGTLKYFPSAAGNTLDSNFNITLYDNSLNSSMISSKSYGGGFNKIETPYKNSSYLNLNDMTFCTMTSNVYFRVGDFKLKNPNIDIQNINQIMFSFGPDYGSTFCHVALDDFIVIKEL